jgi:hypothetical protein
MNNQLRYRDVQDIVASNPISMDLLKKVRKNQQIVSGFQRTTERCLFTGPSLSQTDEPFEIIFTKKAQYDKPRFLTCNQQ